MTGLSVYYHTDRVTDRDQALTAMDRAIKHRGDCAQRFEGDWVSIIRRSEPDDQRQGCLDLGGKKLIVAITGQFYNRDDLLRRLEAPAGEALSDETLAARLYLKYGPAMAEHLEGDFVIIIADLAEHTLLCVRDPLGVQPLFYAEKDGVLLGSEAKQLIAAGVPAEACGESIAAYLSLSRDLTGGARTYYSRVFRIEPGHWMLFNGQSRRKSRYWSLKPEAEIENLSEEAVTEQVRELMVSSVERRLPARGPYACALTGGFDSSSVGGMLREAMDRQGKDEPILSYSFELRDLRADEPELIRIVSEQVRSKHCSIYLDEDNVFLVLDEMLQACDEPARDMGLLYLWRKKEVAHRHGVGVMLSGLGGDEIFFGQYHFLSDLFRRLRLGELWAEIQGVWPVNLSSGKRNSLAKLLKNYVLGPMIPNRWKRSVKLWKAGESVQPWINPTLARNVQLSDNLRTCFPRVYGDAYRQDCLEVFQQILVNVTLPLHEALGAAFGIETRFPLMDKRLVEYMFRLPREFKISRGKTRVVQRRAMSSILPDAVVKEHLKKNLNTVLWDQQRAHLELELKTLFAQADFRCEPYVNISAVRKLFDEFQQGRAGQQAGFVLWYMLNLERWLKIGNVT